MRTGWTNFKVRETQRERGELMVGERRDCDADHGFHMIAFLLFLGYGSDVFRLWHQNTIFVPKLGTISPVNLGAAANAAPGFMVLASTFLSPKFRRGRGFVLSPVGWDGSAGLASAEDCPVAVRFLLLVVAVPSLPKRFL